MAAEDLHLREATVEDLEALVRLEAACFPESWSPSALRAELTRLEGACFVADDLLTAAPQPLAYACFLVVAGEAELLRLAVDPGRRRGGVGRALLQEGLARLGRRGVSLCHLEVGAENHSAIAFYESFGFTLSGRRRGYYRDGIDALLYRLDPLGEAVLC